MKRHHEADERQRVVHLLVRELADVGGTVEHLDAEDQAGLVSGTLLKTEIGRVENHLLTCAECRRTALAMQHDFEAGVVPILLRRAPTRNDGRRLLGPRLPRRLTPWVLGAAAAILAVVLPLTELVPFGSSRRSVTELSLVFRRLGNPQLGDSRRGDARPASPGVWIEPGDEVQASPGDYLEAIHADGSIWALIEGRWQRLDPGDLFSQHLFERAATDRKMIADEVGRMPREAAPPAQKPRLIHPLNRIYNLRPPLRWAGSSIGEEFEIRLYDQVEDRLLFQRSEEGYAMHWPDEVLPLIPGRHYRVELRARPFDGSAAAEATFEVVSEDERMAVEKDLEKITRLVDRGSNMLRAEYLRQKGLHAEAREELERLRQNDGENVELLARLKVAYRRLGLHREESRTMKIIAKRR